VVNYPALKLPGQAAEIASPSGLAMTIERPTHLEFIEGQTGISSELPFRNERVNLGSEYYLYCSFRPRFFPQGNATRPPEGGAGTRDDNGRITRNYWVQVEFRPTGRIRKISM